MELAVTITNVKNQPPQWEKDTYSVVIPENTVRDTAIVVCWIAEVHLHLPSKTKANSHLHEPTTFLDTSMQPLVKTNQPIP